MKRTLGLIIIVILLVGTLTGAVDAARKKSVKRTYRKVHALHSGQSSPSAVALYKKGIRALEQDRYEDAIELLQQAVEKKGTNGRYRLALAEAYYKAAYYDEAAQEATRARELELSLYSESEYMHGLILYERGEFSQARERFADVAAVEGVSALGGKARRMELRAREASDQYKDWGLAVSSGTESNDNLTTQFQDEYAMDQGTITEFSVWYRPRWWQGTLLEYASSEIVYQRLTSANISAQMVHVGSDMTLDPLFSYDYIYSYYWLNGRPYYRSDLVKLMCNVHLVPFEYRSRTGFFISGEERYYYPDRYADYDAQLTKTGIEQTLFNEAVFGSAYYTSSWSDAPENDYRSVNYMLSLNIDLLSWFSILGGYRYEFRAYTDYYGYNRQDMYREPMGGVRFMFWDTLSVTVERRTIDNRSNVSEKEYMDNISNVSVGLSF